MVTKFEQLDNTGVIGRIIEWERGQGTEEDDHRNGCESGKVLMGLINGQSYGYEGVTHSTPLSTTVRISHYGKAHSVECRVGELSFFGLGLGLEFHPSRS